MGNKLQVARERIRNMDCYFVQGNCVKSTNSSYEIVSIISKGSFSQIYRCKHKGYNSYVAMKIFHKRSDKLTNDNECHYFNKLQKLISLESHIVHYVEGFFFNNYQCLVFECLERTLQNYMKSTPLSFKEIRVIVAQILKALCFLHENNIVHGDINPNNILFVNTNIYTRKYYVKLIDFEEAFCRSQENMNVKNLVYSSPEIILGLKVTRAIDMWALGCVMAEMFIGTPLYPGTSEYDQIRYITYTQGIPPNHMLTTRKAGQFFVMNIRGEYKLLESDSLMGTARLETCETRIYKFLNLYSLIHFNKKLMKDDNFYHIDREIRVEFVNLLKQMLQLDPIKRIEPVEAAFHNFISMIHLCPYMNYPDVRDSLYAMHSSNFIQHPLTSLEVKFDDYQF